MSESDYKICKVLCGQSQMVIWDQNWPLEGVWWSMEGVLNRFPRGFRGSGVVQRVPWRVKMLFLMFFGSKMSKTQMQKLQRQKNGALGRNIRSTVFWDFGRHSRLCFIVFLVFAKLHIFRQEPERFCHFRAKSVSGFCGYWISASQSIKSRRWFIGCIWKMQHRNLVFLMKKHVFSIHIGQMIFWDCISETDTFGEIWSKILDRKPKLVSEKQWKTVTFWS